MFPKNTPFSNRRNDQIAHRSDPYTRVRTTEAKTETTNTTVQSATVIDEGSRTISYQTTKQTVTHQQQAGITEISTIHYSPDKDEIEKFLAELNMNSRDLSSSQLKQIFGSSSTTLSTEATTVTQKRGSKTTSIVEEQRIKLNNLRANNNIYTSNYSAERNTDSPKGAYGKDDASFLSTPRAIMSKMDAKPFTSTSSTHKYPSLWETKKISVPSLRPTSSSTPSMASNYKPLINPPPITSFSSSTLYNAQPKQPKSTESIDRTKMPPISIINQQTRLGAIPKSSLASSSKQKSSSAPQLKPGLAFIFNNENFDDGKTESRIGTDADAKALVAVLKTFNLTVEVHKDATLSKINSIIKSIANRDFKRHSCLVIAILTHGSRNERVQARDKSYSIDDDVLFPIMKNPTLCEKPKILFIQACKGYMEVEDFRKDQPLQHGVPAEILKCYSTYEGYVSYRTEQGTFFIQKLCEELRKKGKTESIEVIMKSVTAAVKQFTGGKQIPTMTVNLTEPFVFGDYL